MTDQPLSQGQRVVDVFFAPSRTFADILINRSWWLPFLLGAILSYGYLFAVEKQIGWHTVVQNTLRQDPKASERLANASPEEHARAEAFTETLIKGVFYTSPLLALAIAAIAAAILWGTLNGLFAGKATYGEVFAVWMYGTLPLLVQSLLVIVTLFAGLDKDAFNLNNPIGTNPGFFLPEDSAKWLMTLATSLDVARIWALVLVGMGLAIVGRVKRGLGLAAVFGWWLLILLVRIGYVAIAG